jgi:hypothetical protein
MNDCQCLAPGWCERHQRNVTRMGHRICRGGDARSVASYFKPEPDRAPEPRRAPGHAQLGPRAVPCVHLGGPVMGPDGKQLLRNCPTCRGNVREKVSECHHPGHAADPTTTHRGCERCRDYEPVAARLPDSGDRSFGKPSPNSTETQGNTHVTGQPVFDNRLPNGCRTVAGKGSEMGTLPVAMVAPSQRRPVIWNGGVLQVWVGRMCNQACFGCTQGSHLAGKPGMISVEQYEQAVSTLTDYFGVVGMFGGLPTMHPKFPELCTILKKYIPFERRGLWANDLRGHGAVCRTTFNPKVSNLNVHLDGASRDEMIRDWPECAPYVKGHDRDSTHTTPWVGMSDLVPDEAERWKLIGQCDVNRHWSAMICVVRGELRAFFCEIAGSMAMLHEQNPDWAGTGKPMEDIGLPVEPGWWRKPMADFEQQVRTCCHNCGVPMRRQGQLAIGGEKEEFSRTHAFIARPKVRERPVEFVSIGGMMERADRPSTEYLPGTTPRARA